MQTQTTPRGQGGRFLKRAGATHQPAPAGKKPAKGPKKPGFRDLIEAASAKVKALRAEAADCERRYLRLDPAKREANAGLLARRDQANAELPAAESELQLLLFAAGLKEEREQAQRRGEVVAMRAKELVAARSELAEIELKLRRLEEDQPVDTLSQERRAVLDRIEALNIVHAEAVERLRRVEASLRSRELECGSRIGEIETLIRERT